MQLATGNLHKTPNILEGKGGLEDTHFDNAHDNVPQHGRQHGTKGKPIPLAPTLMDRYRLTFNGQLCPQFRRFPHGRVHPPIPLINNWP